MKFVIIKETLLSSCSLPIMIKDRPPRHKLGTEVDRKTASIACRLYDDPLIRGYEPYSEMGAISHTTTIKPQEKQDEAHISGAFSSPYSGCQLTQRRQSE
ncbi:hypothetical protein AVEN_47824-1 [Araneus ventricosus]|uniref:Uncharacterized protein n=1 Tax=Araneus ventricosus TaxID=182803 RepID=A0A4Y2RHD1_ARAVE|nr:hypothetical protein AVEN_47824-1 [Araneus ventricosus]